MFLRWEHSSLTPSPTTLATPILESTFLLGHNSDAAVMVASTAKTTAARPTGPAKMLAPFGPAPPAALLPRSVGFAGRSSILNNRGRRHPWAMEGNELLIGYCANAWAFSRSHPSLLRLR
ncbi:MAG: hypothetical protein ACREHD_10315 [Pirellulales bacterium]